MNNSPQMVWTFYEKNRLDKIKGNDYQYFSNTKYNTGFSLYDAIDKGSNTFWNTFLSRKYAFIIDKYFDNSHLNEILKHLSENSHFDLEKIIILCLREKKRVNKLSKEELARIEKDKEKENNNREKLLKKIKKKNIVIQYENILDNEKIHDRFVILKNDYDENTPGELWIFGAAFANIYDGLTVATYGWKDNDAELYKYFNNIIKTNKNMNQGSSI